MIDDADYQSWDAVEMARLVRIGELTAAELTEAADRLIARYDPALHAIAEVAPPVARRGPLVGTDDPAAPLLGVPFLVKEVLAVPGLHWSLGSRLFAGMPPVTDAPTPYVERLLAAGLRILGTTTSSEFGLLGSTETMLHGATVNPWRPGWSAGGSSGGSAAAVAAGIVPIAHASDGGGSIRYPAAMTGLFGFMPSRHRCASTGADQGAYGELVVDHAISRTVRDSATLLAATARTGADAVHPPIGLVSGPSPDRRRIGILSTTLMGAAAEPELLAQLARVADLLAELGHEPVDLAPLAVDGAAASLGFYTGAAVAMVGLVQMMTPMLGHPPGADELEPFTLELAAWGATLDTDTVARAGQGLAAAADAYLRVFDSVDVILSPTMAAAPWPLGRLAPHLGREELIRRTEALIGYTPIHNAAGCPAMSLPLTEVEGLPVGMHLAAAPGADAMLLHLAFELEAAAPWAGRRPDPMWFDRGS